MPIDVNGIGEPEIKATGLTIAGIITALGVLLARVWATRAKRKAEPQQAASPGDVTDGLRIMVDIIREDRAANREERKAAREDFQLQRHEMNLSLERISKAMERMEKAIENSARVNEILADYVKKRETTTDTLHRNTQAQLQEIQSRQDAYIDGQGKIQTLVSRIATTIKGNQPEASHA